MIFKKTICVLQPGGCGEKAGRKHTEMLNSGYFWELAICYLYEWPSSLFDELYDLWCQQLHFQCGVFLREILDSLSFYIAF